MPDVSMCADKACPSRERCYRFMAMPSEFLQTYGKFPRPKDADKCDHFWPVDGRRDVRSLDRALD